MSPSVDAPVEVLAAGDELLLAEIPNAGLTHYGEDIYLRYGWKDQQFGSKVVADILEQTMRSRGFVPANGEPQLVVADQAKLAVTINYRESSETSSSVPSQILADLKLKGGGFVLWRRRQPEPVAAEAVRKSMNWKPIIITAGGIALVALLAMIFLRGRSSRVLTPVNEKVKRGS